MAGVRHAVTVVNGTAAMEVVLRALEAGPGDEVIVPPYTFVATATAALLAGATPVFADIDLDTLCIDPEKAAAAITPRTRAIIAVHMAGRPADMDALAAVAGPRGIPVIEDAAQAHGARFGGRAAGSLGAAGCFSFQLTKNMSAGEGGLITVDDDALAERCWSVHNCGRAPGGAWYYHPNLGGNERLAEWQAAVLLAQMERLEEQTAARSRAAARLDAALSGMEGIELPRPDPRVQRHARHLYTFRYLAEGFGGAPRELFLRALEAEGVPCSAGYTPLHKQPLFASASVRALLSRPIAYDSLELPACERACREVVWIPQYVLLGGDGDVDDVAAAIRKIRENVAELRAA
jgi:dTDP-4-amino-4,6-dideoxygalactose transaminase